MIYYIIYCINVRMAFGLDTQADQGAARFTLEELCLMPRIKKLFDEYVSESHSSLLAAAFTTEQVGIKSFT